MHWSQVGKGWTGVTYRCARVRENCQSWSLSAMEACRGENCVSGDSPYTDMALGCLQSPHCFLNWLGIELSVKQTLIFEIGNDPENSKELYFLAKPVTSLRCRRNGCVGGSTVGNRVWSLMHILPDVWQLVNLPTRGTNCLTWDRIQRTHSER